VVFEKGVYCGGSCVDGPEGTDFAQHPLLIFLPERTAEAYGRIKAQC
jgi:hypothetical protein